MCRSFSTSQQPARPKDVEGFPCMPTTSPTEARPTLSITTWGGQQAAPTTPYQIAPDFLTGQTICSARIPVLECGGSRRTKLRKRIQRAKLHGDRDRQFHADESSCKRRSKNRPRHAVRAGDAAEEN